MNIIYITYFVYLSFWCFVRAELVVEEKIEYNDLVNSIQDGTAMHADKDNDTLASVNKDTEPNKGTSLAYECYITLLLFLRLILSISMKPNVKRMLNLVFKLYMEEFQIVIIFSLMFVAI